MVKKESGNMNEQYFEVKRSKFSLVLGFVLAEAVLLFLLFLIVYTYIDTANSPKIREIFNFPFAVFTFLLGAAYFHFLLFVGLFYRLTVNGEQIELRRFLRKTKTFGFSDIVLLFEWCSPWISRYSVYDLKIIGKNNKVITYLKFADRNYELFVEACLKHNISNNFGDLNSRSLKRKKRK